MLATCVVEKMKHTFGDQLHSFCKSCYLRNKGTKDNGPDFYRAVIGLFRLIAETVI
jgi:hypothetical protein